MKQPDLKLKDFAQRIAARRAAAAQRLKTLRKQTAETVVTAKGI